MLLFPSRTFPFNVEPEKTLNKPSVCLIHPFTLHSRFMWAFLQETTRAEGEFINEVRWICIEMSQWHKDSLDREVNSGAFSLRNHQDFLFIQKTSKPKNMLKTRRICLDDWTWLFCDLLTWMTELPSGHCWYCFVFLYTDGDFVVLQGFQLCQSMGV